MAGTAKQAATKKRAAQTVRDAASDWSDIAYYTLLSRALDDIEETQLAPEKKVLYQFSARGHDMAQVMLGLKMNNPLDAVCGYYRSRPLLLSLGVDVADALGSSMGRAWRIFRWPRYWCCVQLSQQKRGVCLADVPAGWARNTHRRQAGRRRLNITEPLLKTPIIIRRYRWFWAVMAL